MKGRWIDLSLPRRCIGDLMHFASGVPTVPVQRQMSLAALVEARRRLQARPPWAAMFLKAYATVAADVPELRRAYLNLPWPHLREYPLSVATVAIERPYQGERCVFFGRIGEPRNMTLLELQQQLLDFVERPIEDIKPFRNMLAYARWPQFLRRPALWLGLNLPRTRPGRFGTFGLSVYSALGAESLHPLSPMTTTLTYGVIGDDGKVWVRAVYDHRVLDGATAARALHSLEDVLNGPILDELKSMNDGTRLAAA